MHHSRSFVVNPVCPSKLCHLLLKIVRDEPRDPIVENSPVLFCMLFTYLADVRLVVKLAYAVYSIQYMFLGPRHPQKCKCSGCRAVAVSAESFQFFFLKEVQLVLTELFCH